MDVEAYEQTVCRTRENGRCLASQDDHNGIRKLDMVQH